MTSPLRDETERIRLVVLFGGRSAEHDVSCVSARHVLAAADQARYDIEPVGITRDGSWVLADEARAALEAGADDMSTEDDLHEVTTTVDAFEAVKKAVEAKGLTPTTAEVMNVPKNRIRVDDEKTARKLLKFFDLIDDHEDVQGFASNEDIPSQLLAQLEESA